ncbi:hypothetical protein KAT08_01090 [Candidatus Babeliales bacterium]|nr:hypothetical protein [Candidatus Babeliales bacterium]
MKKYINLINKKIGFLLLALTFILILPHCAKYKPQRLHQPNGINHEKNDIEITKYVFCEDDCKKYFDRKIITKGYQPIQLFIRNKTNKILLIDSNDITLPLVPVKNVVNKLHRDVGWDATKYFIIGGFRAIEINKQIDEDFSQKTIGYDDIIKIKPNGTFNRVMFVTRENYTSSFGITLIEQESKEKINFDL